MNQLARAVVHIVVVGKTVLVKVFFVFAGEIDAQPNALVQVQNSGHVNATVGLIRDSTVFTRDGSFYFGQAWGTADGKQSGNRKD